MILQITLYWLRVCLVYYPNPRKDYDPKKETYSKYKENVNYEKFLLEEFITHIKVKLGGWIEY